MNQLRFSSDVKRATAYTVGVLALSTFAGVFIDSNESPAALLFVMSPLLVATLLRVTGDGWQDAGLRLSGDWRWYALAVLSFPCLAVITLTSGWAVGYVRFGADAARTFASAFALQLLPALLFASGEELGWRGYLEPRLAAAGVRTPVRHLAVGLIWAVWHVPYILAIGAAYTPLPLAVQLPLFHVAVVVMAFIWGPLRSMTGSAWPAVLGHGFANAVAFPLLDPKIVDISRPLIFAVRPEGLVMLCGVAAIAWFVYRRSVATHRAHASQRAT